MTHGNFGVKLRADPGRRAKGNRNWSGRSKHQIEVANNSHEQQESRSAQQRVRSSPHSGCCSKRVAGDLHGFNRKTKNRAGIYEILDR
jgi:hypothetical protein